MGSGYMPVEADDDVLKALATLRKARGYWGTTCYSACDQYDNSYSDGFSIGQLAAGLALVEEAFDLSDSQKAKLDAAEKSGRDDVGW